MTDARAQSTPPTVRAIVVQPQWHIEDFASPSNFERWMRGQLEQTRPELSSSQPNLVVLTELNGVGLYLQDSRPARLSGRFDWALGLALFRRFPEAVYHSLRERVSLVRGLLLTLAPEVLEQYVPLCAKLAREYKVWLVCGSAPLPHLERSGNRVRRVGSEVYNEALVFSPQGRLVGAADKVYLTQLERVGGLDFSEGRLADLRTVRTPAGNLGIAISLDAFRDDVIAQLERTGADILVQPDANGAVWTGLEQEGGRGRDQPLAWLESAYNQVQKSGQLRYGLNPMVVGNLLDASFDGQSAIVAKPFLAQQPQSYALTEPRQGFLRLMPWVARSDNPDELRNLGRKLASGSGHPYENRYVTGVLSADLSLSPTLERTPRALRPFEVALDRLGQGAALERPWEGWRWTFPALGGGLALAGLALRLRRGKRGNRRGIFLLLLGLLLGAASSL